MSGLRTNNPNAPKTGVRTLATISDLDERIKALKTFTQRATPESFAETMRQPGHVGDVGATQSVPVSSHRPPKGWEPRVTYDRSGLIENIYSPALPEDLPEEEALTQTLRLMAAMIPSTHYARLAEIRLDTSGWQRKQGEDGTGVGDAYSAPVRRYRWVVEPVPTEMERFACVSEEDWNAALKAMRKMKFPKVKRDTSEYGVDLVVPLADWQLGQHDGDGPVGGAARLQLVALLVKEEMERLERSGRPVQRIICLGLGDLVESVTGHYADQLYASGKNNMHNRNQRTLARRMLQTILLALADLRRPVLVACIPGNHGQMNRNTAGKVQTSPEDNADVETFEVVAELINANPVLAEQFEFIFPAEHNQTLVFDPGWGWGTVGLTHGHIARGGGSPHAAITGWLKGQALARTPIGDCSVLVTGHYHSLQWSTIPGMRTRTWIQAPAACDRHEMFTESSGLAGEPALCTFTLGSEGASNLMTHFLPAVETVDGDIDALTK